MKKFLFMSMFSIMLFLSFSLVGAAESNSYPNAKDIESMNNELEELVEQANKQLEQGVTNVELTSGDLSLIFKENNEEKVSNKYLNLTNNFAVAAAGSKSYQAYVLNTSGFNFRHGVSGTFSWDSKGILTAVTGDEDLSGVAYSRSGSTTVAMRDGRLGIDAKVGRVTSKATFTPLKYVPFPFYTKIIVDVYGPTQEYRIDTATITQ